MRICSHCKQEKSLSEFNFKNRKLGLKQYHCKNCSRKYVQFHYYKNKDYYLLKARKRNTQNRKAIKQYIWDYLSKHSCVDCGEKDVIVLEFDHVKDKSFTISTIGRDHRLDDIKKEITKCEVRCANCHRKKTAKERGWDKSILPL
jgi:hypothetical protein